MTFLHLWLLYLWRNIKTIAISSQQSFWPRLAYFLPGNFPFTPPSGPNRLLMSIFAASPLCVVCRLSVFLSSFQANRKVPSHLALPGIVAISVLLSHSLNHECPMVTQEDYHHYQLRLEKKIMCHNVCVVRGCGRQRLQRWEKMDLTLI